METSFEYKIWKISCLINIHLSFPIHKNGDNERCVMFFKPTRFIEKVNSDLIEAMRCKKRQLVVEFGDYKIATMIYALDIIAEMVVLIITNELNPLLEKNDSLPEKINQF